MDLLEVAVKGGDPVLAAAFARARKWDLRFMEMAKLISTWSKDRSTQVGVVVVKDGRIISTGYNGFPRGVNDTIESRHERPAKYQWTEHGDRNALYDAAARGVSLQGCTMYIHSSTVGVEFPCCDCARGIIQSGIVRLVTYPPAFQHERWGEDCKRAHAMLTEAGVKCDSYARP